MNCLEREIIADLWPQIFLFFILFIHSFMNEKLYNNNYNLPNDTRHTNRARMLMHKQCLIVFNKISPCACIWSEYGCVIFLESLQNFRHIYFARFFIEISKLKNWIWVNFEAFLTRLHSASYLHIRNQIVGSNKKQFFGKLLYGM